MKKWFITICAALLLVSLLISFASVTLVGCGSDNTVIVPTVAPTATTAPPTSTPVPTTPTPSGATINVSVQ